MRIVWSEVPEYMVALRRENAQRDCAFFLDRELLCGAKVLPFAPRHLLIMDNIGSPLLRGGLPDEEDVDRFLWVISPKFRVGRCGVGLSRWLWLRRFRKLPFIEKVLAIDEYLDEAFLDSPGSGSPCGAPSDYSFAASLIDRLACEYGWSEAHILDVPFKRFWQYLRAIRKRHDPEATFINSTTDRAKREHWQNHLAEN